MTLDRLITRIERERYAIDNSDPLDVAYRRGFNDALVQVVAIMRGWKLTEALRELRDAPAVDKRPTPVDDGLESTRCVQCLGELEQCRCTEDCPGGYCVACLGPQRPTFDLTDEDR